VLDLLAFATGVALVAATALVVVALARPRGAAAILVSLGVAAFGAIVLVAEALSLIDELGRGGLLVGHALLLAIGGLVWTRSGRPPLVHGAAPHAVAAYLRAAARRHPVVAGLCGVAGATLAIQLVVGLVGAPNNWDSMTYHLSRAAYWLQDGSALRFDGGSIRQLDSLPNAELATAWTMALSGTDRYVELVQWVALLVTGAGIAGLARELGFGRAEAAAAAALFTVLPGPVLQSASTQNDLVAAAFIVGAAFLAARGLRESHGGTLALAGAALGLGLGAKGTVLFALPSIALIAGAAAWRARPARRVLVTAVAAAAAGFVLFGAFQYVQNVVATGTPFADQKRVVGVEKFGRMGNAPRVLWNFVDSPGVPLPAADRVFSQTVQRVIRDTGDPVSQMRVGTEVSEDRIAGGLVGWLVLWPLAFAVLLWPRMRIDRRAQAAAAIAYALAIALQVRATPFNGRVLLPALALAAPLLALAARNRVALGATSALAAISLVPCLLISDSHVLLPERGQPAFFERDRLEQMTAIRPDQLPLLREVDRRFGTTRPLLVVAGEDSWDYPYFGEHRDRRVVRAGPDDAPRTGGPPFCKWLRERVDRDRLAGALVLDAPRDVPLPPPATLPVEAAPGHYVLTAANIRRACG
jgi:hypothetical protein